MEKYDFTEIEKKWQTYWQENETFRQPNPGEEGFDDDKPKFYVLDMFPYPSGAGLHVGHPEGYTATDIVARYKRMKGFNVLHPMGYDAFGLPAEQYAVEHGVHPRETTAANIANIERQIKMFGFSYDWSRRLATTDPDYYRWTQWIFLKMFNSWYDPDADAARPIKELIDKLHRGELVVDPGGNVVPIDSCDRTFYVNWRGVADGLHKFHELAPDQQRRLIDEYRLAYMAEVPVNWCPQLGTVLSNEEVTNEGKSDRGDWPVYRKSLKQWMLRITAYADRLLGRLDELDWPESIKIMQRNWIGRSEGADVDFAVAGGTAFQAVSNEDFSRIAANDSPLRPQLTANTFEGYDPYPPRQPSTPDLMKSISNLPHVIVSGATYFVTFRAKNTTFTDEERDIIFNAMLHWHAVRCVVYAAVVLEDHAHMILRPLEEHALSKILQSIKGFSSREINKYRKASGHIWQDESFDHIIRDTTWLTRFIYYVCDNPEERRLTDRFDQYRWLFVNSDEVETEEGKPFGHSLKGCATQGEDIICVYTTRPDTLFGAMYMVLAPEHPLVKQITTDEHRDAVRAYVQEASRKSELERSAETKEKTGVFTGAYAINPVNGEKIPIWAADYVMMGYGTGAIMAVPAHDTRDLEFAEQFGLPIIQVVAPPEGIDWRGYVDEGTAVNSGPYNGLPTAEFKKKITEWLEEQGLGRAAVNYKLRDWLFSRQRYWGEPFPIVHCDNCGTAALPEDQLPLELPEMDDFTPAASDDPDAPPSPPLAKAADWVNTTCPTCGGPARRETNTMPQWAGSCWYYLRFLDPKNDKAFCDSDIEKYWMGYSRSLTVAAGGSPIENQKSKIKNVSGGVDLYVGGAEHAVLHLLYSRFWHKVLYDLGFVSSPEPFAKLFNQGMIRSYAYRDSRGVYIGYEDVDTSGDKPVHKSTGEVLAESVEKMSKSLKNVVNPDEVIGEYGADTFRLYEMFMGPLEASKPWNTRDVPGVHRFCRRVWRIICGDEDNKPMLDEGAASQDVERALHKLIKKVGQDIEVMKFNTSIAAMMEFVNAVFKVGRISPDQAERFVLVLAPFTPHLAEELWRKLGHDQSLAHESWPVYDESLLVTETVELAVQVNGKMRGRITVAADAAEEAIIAAAMSEPKVASSVEGKTIIKKIVVAGRLVNLVVK